MKKTGIIICSRTDSTRIPNKVFTKVNGVPLIEHLISRLQKTKLPIFIAVPKEQEDAYLYLTEKQNVTIYADENYDDPLQRMYQCAKEVHLKTIIRVTHDKCLVDHKDIEAALRNFKELEGDYLFSSTIIPGTGFELIDFNVLEKAAKKYRKVEFIGYAARLEARKTLNMAFFKDAKKEGIRLLVDYPEDLQLMNLIMSQLGNGCTKEEVLRFLDDHPEFKAINRLPKVTVYTCAYNAEKWIEQCMDSVSRQVGFKDMEYILIDDFSNDATAKLMAKFALKFGNVKWLRNSENIGLASSSGVAIKNARGAYCVRMDADDFFVSNTAIKDMLRRAESESLEIVYPDNYFGAMNKIQHGKENHHVGGALFNKNGLNYVKFTDGLRGHDSLDIFLRAQKTLRIGYYQRPVFFYRQHGESLSKTNLKEREKIKEKILKEAML